jgi:hypothetical protein
MIFKRPTHSWGGGRQMNGMVQNVQGAGWWEKNNGMKQDMGKYEE